MAQDVLQVCNLPVTCPLHLQRRNEICSATFSLRGKLGIFLQGPRDRGKGDPTVLLTHLLI